MTSFFSRSKHHSNQGERRQPPSRWTSARDKSVPLPEEHSTYSEEATRSPRSASCSRLVKIDDDELAALAQSTKVGIDWRTVMLSARVGPARWRRVNVVRDFVIYTRHESQRFAVLAVGVVPGCVAEIVNVLQSPNSAQFAQQMEGIFGDEFREGSFVHRVDIENNLPTSLKTASSDGSTLAELSVKTVTFNKTGWLSHHEEWCYSDAIYHHGSAGVVEKFLTTIQPKDIIAGLSGSRSKYFYDVSCGYLLRPGIEDPSRGLDSSNQSEGTEERKTHTPSVTRVTFYAEFQTPKQFAFGLSGGNRTMAAPDKTIRQRLFKLAESTARLTALVRRQRLGMQVLVDANRFIPPMNTPCNVCTNMLMVAKQCRLCGHAVCSDCSGTHERARQPRGSQAIEVTEIRVCAACIHRVDQAEYANLSKSSLLGPHIVPDSVGAKPVADVLKDLLQDALISAPSPTRKACVVNVIKSLLDQEEEESQGSEDSDNIAGTLIPLGSERDLLQALDSIHVDSVNAATVELRSNEHRIYKIDSSGSGAVPTPVPEDETTRLRAVNRVSVSDLSSSAELEIICDVAAKEMGCTTSAISIIDQDTYHVVASNVKELQNAKMPRETTLCAHTIMEKSPLIVTHPEADIRFNKFATIDQFGVRYYCAFPILGEGDQVIGAMCCVNDESIEITESQFAAFKKLSATASKVVRMETKRRQRKLSTASSTTSGDTGVAPVAPSA